MAIWVGLGVAIFVVAPRYNDAQRAGGVAEFGSVVEAGTPWRFAAAGVLDIGFAVAYGLLGFAIGWREQRAREGLAWLRVRQTAGTIVAVGALCDIAENLVVLANIARRDTLTAEWIDVMRILGDLKWLLGIGGALVLLVAVGGEELRRRRA
ncbi:hypothetical protein BH10ACT3_BH10ACT3_23390 [soil metagenome]